MKFHKMSAVVSTAVLFMSAATFAGTLTFDNPVTVGSTQAPGTWYTDRYAPAGFQGGVSFNGDNRLKQSIAASDSATARPGSFSSAFYNTQGRKYDLDAGTVFAKIDLYVPSDWQSTGRRMAGFWATAIDSSNTVSAYPIVEFTSDSSTPRFRAFQVDTGNWTDLGLPAGFLFDAWTTLEMTLLNNGAIKYDVGNLSYTTVPTDSIAFGNAILQGHNNTVGVSYDIHWDNLSTAVVPLPAAAWMGITLLSSVGGLGAFRKRLAARG